MKRLRFTLTAAAFAALLLAWWATRPKTPTGPAPAPATEDRAPAESSVPPEPPILEAAPVPGEARAEGGTVSTESEAEPLRLQVDRWGTVRLDDEPIEPDALRKRLVAYADGSRDPDDRVHASNREIVLLVDPAAEWGPVRQTLKLCADSDVRIWKIDLRIGGTSHRLALDREGMATHRRFVLRIRPVDGGLEYRLLDRDLGRNDAGRTALAELLKRVEAASDETLIPEIEAAPAVRAEEVAEVLGLCEAAGLPPARIDGAPPSLWKPFLATPQTPEQEDR